MKKYKCIYKYTKGPQSTEIDEKDSNSYTDRQMDRTEFFFFFFLFLTGVIRVGVKPQRHD